MDYKDIIAKQEFHIVMKLTEGEARALDALVGYGGKAFTEHFLPTFYEKLGQHYMKPYEKDLAALFENIRCSIKGPLDKINKARDLFNKPPQSITNEKI